ncbi:MAG: terpene cyclase/mutase family protein [Lentisphaeria bacterium]|nr:terpene cyclase/mutase family protein [Lentisphaeria bacterium]
MFEKLVICCILSWGITVKADFNFDSKVSLSPQVEQAILKAQKYIASKQKTNGSWSGNNGFNGMALIALMVNGSSPGRGPFGAHISKGVQYIVSSQESNGFLGQRHGEGPMYQHGLATLALAEAYGMSQNPQLKRCLTKAVNLTVRVQHHEGGWRYQPKPEAGDLSATVMQVMALKAASDVGIYVPQSSLDYAVKFIRKLWRPKKRGWAYTINSQEVNFNRIAAGVVSMQQVGLHEDPIIPIAVEHMSKLSFDPNRKKSHFWYGHYYASIGFYHYGGDKWKQYYQRISRDTLKQWSEKSNFNGTLIKTCWGVMVLGVPYRYSPIYHR